MIFNTKNKMKTTWKIIKPERHKTNYKLGVKALKINNKIKDNHDMIANTFGKYFISVAY
jgi:hypothetical protein